jgi:hypothetical protein
MIGEAPSGAKSVIESQACRTLFPRKSRSGGTAPLAALFLIAMAVTVPKLTYASINCNSLNMSSVGNNNHLLKIYGITSLRTDIIFLSDVRLCNAMGISNRAVLTDSFRINPYGAYKMSLHSRSNKRGVGILIKHSIDFSVLDEEKDDLDNFLVQKISFDGKIVILCAIYGPNNVQPEFFLSLKHSLMVMGDHPIIMGGDWNCTTSCENSPLNDDIINMRSPPNLRHSILLKNLCQELNLADPYRVKFPHRKEFTFVPKDTT